jgi:hemerythrin-like domain-containing protein
LSKDHELITNFNDLLNKFVFSCGVSKTVNKEDLEFIIDFFENFIDDYHHVKEEKYVFAELIKNPLSRMEGIFELILNEHDIGRNHISELKDALETSDVINVAFISKNLKRLEFLMGNHIKREDEFFFQISKIDALLDNFQNINFLLIDFENKNIIDQKRQFYSVKIHELLNHYVFPEYKAS